MTGHRIGDTVSTARRGERGGAGDATGPSREPGHFAVVTLAVLPHPPRDVATPFEIWRGRALAVIGLVFLAAGPGCGTRTPLEAFELAGGDDDDDDVTRDASVGDDDDDDVTGELTVEVRIQSLVQDCMPVIANDNVFFEATLALRNGAMPIPESTVQTIEVLRGRLVVARFEPSATTRTIPPLMPGARLDVELRKASPSLDPPLSCTLCGGTTPDTLRVTLLDELGAVVAVSQAPLAGVLECLG